jgi:hypothetical protein
MEPNARVRADRPSVIDETFDGEAVVVHLGTGRYYALNAAATEVWRIARDGISPSGAARLLGEDRGEAATAFLAELQEEGLLVPANGSTPAAEAPASNGLSEAWADPPALQRFDDLQDLLLVDPIHDVTLGPDGWPLATKT